jgi:hypothetical protein
MGGCAVKTTLDISDGLMLRIKALAKRNGTTIRSLMEEGLEMVLAARSSARPAKVTPVTFRGSGLSREFQGASWDRIRAAAYEGRGS